MKQLQSAAFNRQGIAEFNRGDYAAAIRSFQTAANLATTDENLHIILNNIANSYHNLGVAASERNNNREALRLYQLALENKLKAQQPESDLQDVRANIGNAHMRLGIDAYYRGQHAEAFRRFESAIRINPDGKMSDGKSYAEFAARWRELLVTQKRQAEEERNAPIKRQTITKSIDAVTASIEASARDSAEKDKALSGLIGELEKATEDGCFFDGRRGCPLPVVPKHEAGLRGTASLSAEVRRAMINTPDGKKLLEEEAALRTRLARADAEVAELKNKMEAASPAIRAQLAVEYSEKDIERSKTEQQLNFKEFEVEKAADVTVVELRRRNDKR